MFVYVCINIFFFFYKMLNSPAQQYFYLFIYIFICSIFFQKSLLVYFYRKIGARDPVNMLSLFFVQSLKNYKIILYVFVQANQSKKCIKKFDKKKKGDKKKKNKEKNVTIILLIEKKNRKENEIKIKKTKKNKKEKNKYFNFLNILLER
ncbi:hypothetical protein RFI_22473 [Reticulomyxa filosa]|uniref:Transmembrane protein n=1 Tax=Reticulomyxa filosa TaxID=46433 RepID=X6MPB8_RETFI|nr:hypothetical protein RFI_22473 [Reticulomyxa filosa]|eukprot:ETO14895.1 hypothetical protein RFI_22473 [Reticulomyxa filosa]